MLNLHQLRLLRELAHRGTIAAVAEALSYSPSAVSQQLSQLERKTGITLLERSGRRVALTPAGTKLVRRAEAILEHLEAAQAELVESRGATGPLRTGFYPSAAGFLSASVYTALRASHPRLELWIQEIDPVDAPDALRAGQLDLALVHSYEGFLSPVEAGVESKPVFTERMLLAAPADPTTLGWKLVDVAEPVRRWSRAPWILPAEDTLCHAAVTRLCEANGFQPDSWHRVDDYDTTLKLVKAGVGVAVVPELSALPSPGITLTALPMTRRSAVAFRSGAGTDPSIQAFMVALHEVQGGLINRRAHIPSAPEDPRVGVPA
ncbi:LysR family transcriptional regulator [Streptomyces sp. NPDC001514]